MAMNTGVTEEAEAMADINVTPLVDVMLVLLIIFIITIRVIIQQVPVQLPKATNLPTQTKPENITIAIDKDGDIFWNTQKLTSTDELKQKLRVAARDRAAARGAYPGRLQRPVSVRGPGAGRHSADRNPQGGVHHDSGSFRSGNIS